MRRSLPALLALVALVLPAVAHADADPASDTLYTGRVFLPLSAKVSPRLARELDAVTLEAERAGRPVRVALAHACRAASRATTRGCWRRASP